MPFYVTHLKDEERKRSQSGRYKAAEVRRRKKKMYPPGDQAENEY